MSIEKSEKQPLDGKEKTKLLKLEIREKDLNHNYGIVFISETEEESNLYNSAFLELAQERRDLSLFHQSGNENEIGRHYWELLGFSNGRTEEEIKKELEDIMEDIQERVQKIIKIWQ